MSEYVSRGQREILGVQNDIQAFGLSPDVVKQGNLKGTRSPNHDCLLFLEMTRFICEDHQEI